MPESPEPQHESRENGRVAGVLLSVTAVILGGWAFLELALAALAAMDDAGTSLDPVLGSVWLGFGLAGGAIALLWLARWCGTPIGACATSVCISMLLVWVAVELSTDAVSPPYSAPHPGVVLKILVLTGLIVVAGVILPIVAEVVRGLRHRTPEPPSRFRPASMRGCQRHKDLMGCR